MIDKNKFINTIAPIIQRTAKEFGICVVSPIIAQACLESAYGSSDKAKEHNYFGLKYRDKRVSCHSGTFVDGSNEQLADGSYVPIKDQWYSFDSMENGVRGYFEFISIPRYSNLIGVSSPKRYLKLLKEDGYATSLDYVDNIYNVIVSNNLHRFDYNSGGKISSMKYNKDNKPLVCMQTNSTCYKGTRKMEVKGILFHSTGCNNPNIKRYVQPSDGVSDYGKMISIIGKNTSRTDWNHIESQAGLNAWIGKLEDGTVAAVQTMPWNYRPWGCGSGNRGSCNDGWIQFEICEDSLKNEDYFLAVYKEAIELCAYLCKMYGLNPKGLVNHNGVSVPVITCHADAHFLGLGSNHGDINHWFPKYGKNMNDVRNDIEKLLASSGSNGVSSSKEDSNSSPSAPKDTDKDNSSVKYYVQAGAFKSKTNADNKVKELFTHKFNAVLKKSGNLYIVQCGAFANKSNAQKLVDDIKSCGIDACISTVAGDVIKSSSSKTLKSVSDVAKEVINGKWGNGSERKKRLTDAGYNYSEVKSLVNKMLRK